MPCEWEKWNWTSGHEVGPGEIATQRDGLATDVGSRAGMEKLTADLTDSEKGLSGTQYRNQKQRRTAILSMCKQGKAFHRFKVQGGVNVFKLLYQFNPDFKVWLAQTQKL